MMTKEHFKALAEALAEARPKDDGKISTVSLAGRYVQRLNDVEAIANVCAKFNPAFDRAKFLDACGY